MQASRVREEINLLASMLQTRPEVINAIPKLSFATTIRNHIESAVTVSYQPGKLEALPTMSASDFEQVLTSIHEKYCEPADAVDARIAALLNRDPESGPDADDPVPPLKPQSGPVIDDSDTIDGESKVVGEDSIQLDDGSEIRPKKWD